ncbi:nSTAND1 domain-containing NTPase [Nodularia spumigena]|uniref:nSTAND1 domain-containing NTPase n=1 Tax=Nodularia spumigena TaxID=70799 RepID=UPI002B1F5F65|nr:CHAT domain-containing protein [Nodularia spumigena]MEA5558784.1 CHAT domain-containing protein [Nodularia spumigena CH309]
MTKLVLLKLDGDLQQGVRVTLSIANEGISPHKEVTGNLPPVTELQTKIDQWRSHYRSLGTSTRGIKPVGITYDGSITQKYEDCKNSAKELQKRLNNWLLSESFRPIRESWLKELQEKELVRVLIRTSNQQLRQIPWHLWDLVEEYPNAELALSATDYQKTITAKTPTKRDQVKILAILGNSTGIDIETDRKLLNSLPDADVTFLVQPQRHEINDSLWESPWDILFFAGHSQTVGDSGRIYINENQESLTTDDLKYGLKKAKSNGLAVAIFNSCDGLGLGSELGALQIPQIIVMREQVPDEVAQIFLKHFLVAYAHDGKPLYQAAKEARLKLHGLEDKYPCASLLPVICQNADTVPPSWLELGRRPTEISPYRGLFAFQEEDAQFFFGRETFTQMLVEAVQNQPLVAVIGSSGSGKSSVVFAGLAKRLRDAGNWHIVDFRPGSRPLFNLAIALISQKETDFNPDYHQKGSLPPPVLSRTERLREIRNLASDLGQCENGLRDVVDDILCLDSNQRLLLVADQFEELYTLCTDAQERKAFLDRLLEAISHCRNFTFVITLRVDFLGQALSYRPFADALQYADLKLSPMTDEELQAAVEKPGKLLGVTIEEGLAERILSTVSAEPGDLPLLEFTLTQLWAKQQDAQMTHAAYDEIGGVEAALARYADEAYNQLNFEEKERAQRIFIQLVHPGEGTEDTRRVATRAEVGEENWDLVTRLATARLVVTGRDEKTGLDTVEVVHEALIRSWGQLHQWMQQDRDFRQWQESLRVAMRTWESSGFDEGALLRGKPLVDTEYWERQRFLELSTVERSFIGLSVEFRERESRKKKRRRQFTVLGLSIGLVVALSLAGVAGWQSQNSLKSEIQALSASSEALFASNQELEGLTAGIRAGQQLKKLPWVDASTQTTVANVLQNVLYRIKEYNRLEGHRGGASQFVFSSNGQIIATVGKDGTVKLWKPDGTPLNRPWLNNFKEVSAVAFSPKNQIIATASGDTVTLWSLDGVKQKILSAHKGDIGAIAFSPDSKIIAIATTKVEGQQKINTLQLWNPDNGTLLKNLEGVNVQMAIAFSPDGKIIASGGWGGLKLWKADGGWQPLQSYQQGAINAVSFSPNSQIIAAASVDKNVYLWKRDSTGKYETKPDKILQGHSDAVWGVNFSPEGELIATASGDKTVKIWKTDGSLVTTLKGHRDVVRAVAYSPDAQTLASASDDGSVKLWKPDGTSLKALKHDSQLYAVAYSPNDKKIITTNGHGYVSFWQDNGKLLKTEKWRGGPVQTAVFSPNGELIVITSSDRSVQISKSDGTAPKFLAGHTGELNQKVVLGASFSPDSQMIATGGEDGTVQLWTTDGKLYKTLQAGGDRVWGVSFSPNGELMASAHNDKTVKLWKRDGTLLKTLSGHRDAVRAVAFSPDDQIIATASNDKTVKLWKRDGTLLKTLSGHRDAVRAVAFSPDDQIIATASNDKTVKLWKRHGTLLKTLSGHGDTVRAVAFSPDGKTLASASKDETVILWDLQKNLDIKQLLVFGCDWVRDYLKTNPNVSDNDKHLCDGVANKK